MAYKKLEESGLRTLIDLIKTEISNTADKTAEDKYKDSMREYFVEHGSEEATPTELTAICDSWFGYCRRNWDGYVQFYHPDKSNISTGTKGGDNARMECVPSTLTDKGRDDYAGNSLFAPTDCNWVMGADGQPIITSIDGIPCATEFVRNDPGVYVGVLQMTGYHWWTELTDDSDYYYEGYTSYYKNTYRYIEPLPEAVLPDDVVVTGRELLEATTAGGGVATVGGVSAAGCNVRTWVLHSKYMTDLQNLVSTDDGVTVVDDCMTSYSGGPTKTYVFSHNSSHVYAANNSYRHGFNVVHPYPGSGSSAYNPPNKWYSGATIVDNAFLILMARIKYGSLTMDGIIQGCVNYSFQYPIAHSEEGTTRVLVTTAQAANIVKGSNLLVGVYENGSIDRARANTYSISSQAGYVVQNITTVVIDGVTYGAIEFDDSITPFNSVNNGANTDGTTYISSFIWRTGSCDEIMGNDGSPCDTTDPTNTSQYNGLTNGKFPAKLQGLEYMMGAYEVFADVILNLYKEGDEYKYQPYLVRKVEYQRTSITADYVASGIVINQGASAAWYYIVYMQYKNGLYFSSIVTGGSSTTYTRDAIYMESNLITTRAWLSFGYLWNGVGLGGLSTLFGHTWLGNLIWIIATRLSCNGNRGVYVAA